MAAQIMVVQLYRTSPNIARVVNRKNPTSDASHTYQRSYASHHGLTSHNFVYLFCLRVFDVGRLFRLRGRATFGCVARGRISRTTGSANKMIIVDTTKSSGRSYVQALITSRHSSRRRAQRRTPRTLHTCNNSCSLWLADQEDAHSSNPPCNVTQNFEV